MTATSYRARVVDATAPAYHADLVAEGPTLSSSIAKVLIASSPAHARAAHPRFNPELVREQEKKFDLGTAAHALLLEGSDAAIAVIDADAYRSAAAKQARSEAYLAGKTPVLAKDLDQVKAMVDAAHWQLQQFSPVPFTDGAPEQPIVWEDNGVLCRALIDWLRVDGDVDDYKTTGASAAPEAWGRTMFGFAGDIQVAFHSRGVRAFTGRQPTFRFVTQELAPPYALSVFALSPDALAIADAKVDYAIHTWRRCLETGRWPAYPHEVCYLPAPPWAENQWLDRAARDTTTSTDRRAAA